jgi:transcriptional regulator with XRE-family HTH domain
VYTPVCLIKGLCASDYIARWRKERIMEEIYYKLLIKRYGLWKSPQSTATILKEAKTYNYHCRKDLKIKFHWKDIAEDIGISKGAISRIVTGKGFPRKETMERLIKYLDLVAE